VIATLGWTPAQAMPLTLRELVVMHDAYALDRWDHTASVCCVVHNLTALVSAIGGKPTVKPRTVFDFHPYRQTPRQGLRITGENFDMLRLIGNAMCK